MGQSWEPENIPRKQDLAWIREWVTSLRLKHFYEIVTFVCLRISLFFFFFDSQRESMVALLSQSLLLYSGFQWEGGQQTTYQIISQIFRTHIIITPGSNLCDKIQISELMLYLDETLKVLEWSECTFEGKEDRILLICDQRESSGVLKMTKHSLKLLLPRSGTCCLLP